MSEMMFMPYLQISISNCKKHKKHKNSDYFPLPFAQFPHLDSNLTYLSLHPVSVLVHDTEHLLQAASRELLQAELPMCSLVEQNPKRDSRNAKSHGSRKNCLASADDSGCQECR